MPHQRSAPLASTMGFETELFVEKPLDVFICAVCHDVLNNPVCGCDEGHLFCRSCITPVKVCPLDQGKIIKLVPSRAMESLINTLRVCCKHSKAFQDGPVKNRDDEGATSMISSSAKEGVHGETSPHLASRKRDRSGNIIEPLASDKQKQETEGSEKETGERGENSE